MLLRILLTLGSGAVLPVVFAQDTLVANTLAWYGVWGSLSEAQPGPQVCKGELQNGLYTLRCDPLSVVLSLAVDTSGRCSVLNVRESVFAQDGLRVNGAGSGELPRSWKCGELPTRDGPFKLSIVPRKLEVDELLSGRGRDAALAYIKRTTAPSCRAYFPLIRKGDPFFHVYEMCDGFLEAIFEFKIEEGQVSTSPQWTYVHKNLAAAAGWRLDRSDLWFDMYRSPAPEIK